MAELRSLLASWEFTWPAGLLAGGALVLLWLLLQARRPREGLAFDLQHWSARVGLRSERTWVMTFVVIAVSTLAVAALAAPQVLVSERVSIYGKPVMAVVDISGSMDYQASIRPSSPSVPVLREERSSIEKARAIFQDVLSRDLSVHYGLLLYSTEHYVARHFAFKRALLQDSLENDEEVTSVSTGTRTAEALVTARRYLTENVGAGDKAILLISDMQGDMEAAVAMATEMENCEYAGIKLYVIRIGSDGATIDDSIASPPQVEGVMMVEMSDRAGVDAICRELMAMQDSPVNAEETRVRKNATPFLAATALGLALLCIVLSEGRFRRIP